jgi:polyisoprenoid-binding protein YceI
MKKLLILASALAILGFRAQTTNYTLDKNHSRLSFTATHFGISHVEGNFKNFDATLKTSKEDMSDAVIEMSADAATINTEVEMRDKDLRSSNWLDVEKFPKIIFKSSSFKPLGGKKYQLEGNISIHGITRFVSFDVTYNGKATNPMSKKTSVGFSVSGKLNRKDFVVGTEAFATVVGTDVDVKAEVEFVME